MLSAHVSTLVIGSGFAGRAVASRLPSDSVALAERGEARSFAQAQALFRRHYDPAAPFWVNAQAAWRSALPFNRTYALSPRCFSQFEFIAGGSSNRWTGRAVRLSAATFRPRYDGFDWPLSYATVTPYFQAAEQTLNVAVDPLVADQHPGRPQYQNANYWRELLQPHLQQVVVDPQAKNLLPDPPTRQGRCCGAGDCEACPVDAKARPATTLAPVTTYHGHLVQELLFRGSRAVAARCWTNLGERLITFDRVVVAAHAVESVALLTRSALPAAVPRLRLGQHFQDHALVQFLVKCARPVDYRNLGVMTYVTLGELCGTYQGLEVATYAHVEQPAPEQFAAALDADLYRRAGPVAAAADLRRLLLVDTLLEMPPATGIAVDACGRPQLRDDRYLSLLPRYDAVTRDLQRDFARYGFEVVAVLPHYRHLYGTHHLMGTLPFGLVTAPDFSLQGTTNVYVAGAALFPRVGAQNPTLTLTALALMLGDQLAQARC